MTEPERKGKRLARAILFCVVPALAGSGCAVSPRTDHPAAAVMQVIEQLPPEASPDAALVPSLVGRRAIRYAIRDREIGNVAWYRLKADYNAVLRGDIWSRVQWPADTRLAAPVRFQQNACLIKGEDDALTPVMLNGLRFSESPNLVRNGGTRPVVFHDRHQKPLWLVAEKGEDREMQFRLRRRYMLCFTRGVVPKKPADDLIQVLPLDAYTEFLHGVVEIEPTFEVTSASASSVLYVPEASFVSLTLNWEGITLVQRQDGNVEVRNAAGAAAVAPRSFAQQARYMINTLRWRPAVRPNKDSAEGLLFENARPRVTLTCRTQAGFSDIAIRQSADGWLLAAADGGLYRTPQPPLCKELAADLHEALETGIRRPR